MNEVIEKENIKIEDMIYEIRCKQVMLDRDLAKLYNVETRILNQAVKRNIDRFPDDFCFQLTNKEIGDISLRSQIVTLNKNYNLRGLHFKYLPYVFTEHGIIMLSGLLKSDIAVEMNKAIIRAFVNMKKYISSTLIEQKYINNLVIKDNERINLLEESFSKLSEKTKVNSIFFEGQIYDAYSLMVSIIKESRISIIIIDNYVDKSLLDILSKIDKKITIITNKYNNEDYNKYKKQYSNVELKINNAFHDRFIVIDRKILYHCGSSFKDLGKKCFAITKIEEKNILKQLLENSSL
ncbi:MAG: ORF6N domain-containing protein [bacterium]|nr:ORF6N domain-containing protein [bacterium]